MNRQHDNKIEAELLVEAEGITLNDLWNVLLEFKLLIISLTVIAIVIATVYVRSVTPTYLATTLIVPAQSQNNNPFESLAGSGLGGLASLTGISFNQGNDDVSTALAIFKSKKFIEQHIHENDLIPILFANDWDKQKKSWKDGQEPTIWGAYNVFRKNINVIKNNNLITVSFEWTDPIVAAELANNSIKRLNQHMRTQTIQETEKSIYFLQQQLEQTSLMDAQQMLFSLIEEQTKNIMIANVRDEYIFKVIDPAFPPQSKHKPNTFQIVFLGISIGFMIGYLLAFFKRIIGFNIPLPSSKHSNI